MVTFYYKDSKKITLDKDKRQAYAKRITELFKKYYKDLDAPRKEALEILKELFPDYKDKDKISKVPDLYEQYKTYTSALQRACYPNYDSLVDIEGQDLRSNDLASIYKASLVYDYNNINLKSEIDDMADDWAIKGESAGYVCWKEEVYQKTIKDIVPVLDENGEPVVDEYGMPVTEEQTTREDVPEFQGVMVKRIDPHNLYFDKSRRRDWEHCPKIYRDFIDINTILANQNYSFTKEEKDEMKALVNAKDTEYDKDIRERRVNEETERIGTELEVLEYDGDFVTPDTFDVLIRVEATVIAGKYLASFKLSEKPKSSIIWGAYMERPDTGRGQSPLRIPSILNAVENMCMDLNMRAWQLNVTPTFLAPKGAFDTYTALKPGKPIEYDNSVLMNQPPQRIDFSSGYKGFDFTDFFKNKMENATGINQYMQGSQDNAVRTASEASYIHAGGNMRMAREASMFTERVIAVIVKRHALFKKVYDVNDTEVKLANGDFAKVTDEVRNGQYTFIIGGSQSQVEREAETDKLMQLLGMPTFQTLVGGLDKDSAIEILRWIMNRMNFRETDQVLSLLNLTAMIQQQGREMGVQPGNMPQFQQDLMNRVKGQVPIQAQQMANEATQRPQ